GGAIPSAAPAQLPRRVAAPALHAALQPALAVSVSRTGAARDRVDRRGVVDPRAADGWRRDVRRAHAPVRSGGGDRGRTGRGGGAFHGDLRAGGGLRARSAAAGDAAEVV